MNITNWPSNNIYGGVEVLEGMLNGVIGDHVEKNKRELAPLMNSYSCPEKLVI